VHPAHRAAPAEAHAMHPEDGAMSVTYRPMPAAAATDTWRDGAGPPDVRRFLQGPQPRGFERARVVRIGLELVRGFRALHTRPRTRPRR
jgi:hypothetical protein